MIKEDILKNYLRDPIIDEMDLINKNIEELKWTDNYPVLIQVLKEAINGVKEGTGESTILRKMNKILDTEL